MPSGVHCPVVMDQIRLSCPGETMYANAHVHLLINVLSLVIHVNVYDAERV